MKLHAKMLAKTLDMKHGIEEHKKRFSNCFKARMAHFNISVAVKHPRENIKQKK